MVDKREERQGGDVILSLVAGKFAQQVPVEHQPGGAGMAEEREVLAGEHAFLHAAQQRRGERLNPGLDPIHASAVQKQDLFERQVGLGFIEDPGRGQLVRQPR